MLSKCEIVFALLIDQRYSHSLIKIKRDTSMNEQGVGLMTARHRRFIWIEQGVVPMVFNFFINGFIAWAIFQSMSSVPFWGAKSMALDLLATGFLLPFLSTLIAGTLIKKQIELGMVPALEFTGAITNANWLRFSLSRFGSILGVIGVMVCAAPLVWVLDLAQVESLSVEKFILFKSGWTMLLSLWVSPLVGYWALLKVSKERALS